MPSNDSKLPTPRAVVRALNGMLDRLPMITALAPFAITASAAAAASEADKEALAALVAVYAPDSSAAPEVRALQVVRTILLDGFVNGGLAPAPVDSSPEAREASMQALFAGAIRAPGYYCSVMNRDSALRAVYTKNTGLPWWEIIGADGRIIE